MAATGFSELRSGYSVVSLCEDEDWTYCEYADSKGDIHRIKSRFFVGADGETGFTRKKYLEPKGIHMERAHKYDILSSSRV